MRSKGSGRFELGVALFVFAAMPVGAQELAPRAYWPLPNGTTLVAVGLLRLTGDIIVDPSLPIIGVDSDIWFAQLSLQRTFDLAGRTATVLVSVPYSQGTTEGTVNDVFLSRYLSGMADIRVRLGVNLVGAPTMDLARFQELRAAPRPQFGVSVEIVAPTGQYQPDTVLNLGTNRWAVRSAAGFIYPVSRSWLTEFELATWLFSDNDDFLGTTRAQAPVFAGSFHLVKRIRPGFWASLDVNAYGGGRTTIRGVVLDDLQRNSRIGGTLVIPIKQQHSIRPNVSFGVVTESGGDFVNLSLTYLFLWN